MRVIFGCLLTSSIILFSSSSTTQQAPTYNFTYKTGTGEIVMSGPAPFIASVTNGEATAMAPGPINHRMQRYTGAALRAATAQEIADYDSALLDLDAIRQVDDRAIKAAVITSLWGRLGRQPTNPEIAAERTRFINIYKVLQ